MPDDTPTASAGFPPANADGTPALVGPDEYTRQVRRNRIDQNNTTVLSGNYADLQRAGADAAVNASGSDKAYAAPPGTDPKDDKVKTPAQAEADRGEFTRETARTGLLEAPPAAEPRENTEPDSVDPTSQSPQQQSKGGGGSGTTSTSPRPATTTATKK